MTKVNRGGGPGVLSWATTYFDNYRKAAAGHSFIFLFFYFFFRFLYLTCIARLLFLVFFLFLNNRTWANWWIFLVHFHLKLLRRFSGSFFFLLLFSGTGDRRVTCRVILKKKPEKVPSSRASCFASLLSLFISDCGPFDRALYIFF